MASFYLTLPSNASMDVFPDNTLTTYRTLLPETINLHSEYECAMSEIFLPREWFNLREDVMYVLQMDKSEDPIRSVRRIQKLLSRKNVNRALVYSLGSTPHGKADTVQRKDVAHEMIKRLLVVKKEVEEPPTAAPLRLPAERAGRTRAGARGNARAEGPPAGTPPALTGREDTPPPVKRRKRTVTRVTYNNKPVKDDTEEIVEELFRLEELDNIITRNYEGERKYKIVTYEGGIFNNNKKFLDHLNRQLGKQATEALLLLRQERKNTRLNIFEYSEHLKKVNVNVPSDHLLIIPEELSYQLGMNGNRFLANQGQGGEVMDIHHNAHAVYVYTDIIKHNIVGDAHAPLLRAVSLKWKESATAVQNISFSNLHYRPVKSSSFREISVYLRDATGRPVPFERGHVSVVLAFRPSGQ